MSDRVDRRDVIRLIENELGDIQRELHKFIVDVSAVSDFLDELADALDVHFSNISKAKVAGSSVAIVGGVVATVGFALSFFTFGATLPLLIAGSVIGGVGGLTAAGSAITDVVLAKGTKSGAKERTDEHNARLIKLHEACKNIGLQLNQVGNVDDHFPHWLSFWVRLVYGTGSTIKTVSWNLVANPVINGLRLSSYIDDVARVGAQATPMFKGLGGVARGFHIAGGVAGILLMAVDIYTLVDSSIDIHKGNSHQVSIALRMFAQRLRDECPSRESVDEMIEQTRGSLAGIREQET